MNIYFYLCLVLTSLTFSCQSSGVQPTDTDGKSSGDKSGVTLYLISSPVDLSVDPMILDKKPLILDKEPLIYYDQIDSYSADNHTFRVTNQAIIKLKEISDDIPFSGKPFALVVDDTIVYAGLFWNPISSFSAAYPFIVANKVLDTTGDSNALFVAFMTPPPGGITRPDLRNHPRLLSRLRQDNKLK